MATHLPNLLGRDLKVLVLVLVLVLLLVLVLVPAPGHRQFIPFLCPSPRPMPMSTRASRRQTSHDHVYVRAHFYASVSLC